MTGKSLSVEHVSPVESYQGEIASHDAQRAAPIELGALMRRCLDDRGFCAMILHKFAARAADQIAALERAFESANSRELAWQAHTLQGVAANLSAAALRARAEELEAAATRGDLESAGGALERTRGEMARCLAALPGLLARVGAQS